MTEIQPVKYYSAAAHDLIQEMAATLRTNLIRLARSRAVNDGRDTVTDEDVQAVANDFGSDLFEEVLIDE